MKAITILLVLSSLFSFAAHAESRNWFSCSFKDNKFGTGYLKIQEVTNADPAKIMKDTTLETKALNADVIKLTLKKLKTYELEDGVKLSYSAIAVDTQDLFQIDFEVKEFTDSYTNCYGQYGIPKPCTTTGHKVYRGYVKIESDSGYSHMGLVECQRYFINY